MRSSMPQPTFNARGPLAVVDERCEIVRSIQDLEELSADWSRLSVSQTAFQQFSWFRAYWRAFGSDLKVFTPVVRAGPSVVAILPLLARGRTLEFPRGDYNDLICDESSALVALQRIFLTLFARQSEWDECVLENVPAHSRLVRFSKQLPDDIRRRLQLVYRYPCPTVVAREPGELRKLAGKKDIRRQLHRLERAGQLCFRHIESRGEILAHLPDFFRQHIERRAIVGQRSRFLHPEPRAFYENLVQEFDPTAMLRFSVLELDKQPLAYHFGFEYNGTFLRLTSVFDVNHWLHSPGEVLLGKLLDYADGCGIREFDFGIGGENYKRRFANHVKQNMSIYVTRPGISVGQLKRNIRGLARKAKEWLNEKAYAQQADLTKVERAVRTVTRAASAVSEMSSRESLNRTLGRAARTVFSREEISVFVSAMRGELLERAIQGKLSVATLGQIAVVSLDNPELLPRLKDYRERLKQGDTVVLYKPHDATAILAWVGERSAIEVPADRPVCRIELGDSEVVLYDFWSNSSEERHVISLIDALATKAAQAGRRLWVLYPNSPHSVQLPSRLDLEVNRICRCVTILGVSHASSRSN